MLIAGPLINVALAQCINQNQPENGSHQLHAQNMNPQQGVLFFEFPFFLNSGFN
jgi:hypothetical protein